MHTLNKYSLLLILLSITLYPYAQDKTKDQLVKALNTSQHDSIAAQAYVELGIYFYKQNNPKQSAESFSSAIKSSEDEHLKAKTLKTIGDFYVSQSEYQKALNLREQELHLRIRQKNIKEIGSIYNNLAIIYSRLSKQKTAIEYYHKAIKINTQLGDQKRLSDNYSNLAFLYQNMKDYRLAQQQYEKAIAIKTPLNDPNGLGACYLNFGSLLIEQHQYQKATQYLKEAITIYTRIHENTLLGYALVNMADAKLGLQNHTEALNYLKQAQALPEKNNYLLGGIYQCYGEIYQAQSKYPLAITNYQQAQEYHLKTSDINAIHETQKYISACQAKSGNFQDALHTLQHYAQSKDSTENAQNIRTLSEVKERYESEKKEKEISLKDLEIKQQKKIRYLYLITGILLLAALIYLSLSIRNIIAKNQLISLQKETLETQQNQTLQNIQYAQTIQSSILPPLKSIQAQFPEFFVLYKPRDIVSGDFYWFHHSQDLSIFAAVDCTGHGVPGALMSMLGNRLLHEIISINNITNPAEILEHLNQGVVQDLKQNDKNRSQDGMDLFLATYHHKTRVLTYSGARNKAYLIEPTGTLHELKTPLKSIGGTSKFDQKFTGFTNQQHQVPQGAILYLFSDGIIDQFGGPHKKKFGSKQFKEMLLHLSKEPLNQQQQSAEQHLKNWQGKHAQIDDILLIGLKL